MVQSLSNSIQHDFGSNICMNFAWRANNGQSRRMQAAGEEGIQEYHCYSYRDERTVDNLRFADDIDLITEFSQLK